MTYHFLAGLINKNIFLYSAVVGLFRQKIQAMAYNLNPIGKITQ